ncbi:MAG: nucleoid occlusion factor SlmA, partial [Gammaproteobacteria bacterium]
ERRREILEALARELEAQPGARITTARLASVVGVSEAALYRHFPSKARMFEGLFDFAEESVFGITNRLLADDGDLCDRLERVLGTLLRFAERNPGIACMLLGDALVDEHERLRGRASQFFDRLEVQIKQALRTWELTRARPSELTASHAANLLVAVIEGRMHQFSRSRFEHSPLQGWEEQWRALRSVLFTEEQLPVSGAGEPSVPGTI